MSGRYTYMRGHAAWRCDATTKVLHCASFQWPGRAVESVHSFCSLVRSCHRKASSITIFIFYVEYLKFVRYFFFYLSRVILQSFRGVFRFLIKILRISYHPARFSLKQAAGNRIVSDALKMVPSLLCCISCRGEDIPERVLPFWRPVSGLCNEDMAVVGWIFFFGRSCSWILEF
jgi:hypothetical protein